MSAWATWPVPANDSGSSPSSNNCGPRCCCWPKPNDTATGRPAGSRRRHCQLLWSEAMGDQDPAGADPFARLRRQAAERSDRTVERISAGIAALRAGGQKITAESLKQATRELEPGFAGLSFQVIRRNPRAYALYRAAADAFSVPAADEEQPRPRPRERGRRRTPRSAYDPLQRFDKKVLIQRI